ncbi:hypothetical protein GCM10010975_14960 [Comamonas phosphati]|nr:hypothetical protein GCM10010975_14960 [Comamonas phosphati]
MVPRHVGTGGKTQQLSISKRGDTYLRTLLIAGARAVIARSGKFDWIERLLQRRHYNLVAVALANTVTRIAWALLAWGMAFARSRWNPVAGGGRLIRRCGTRPARNMNFEGVPAERIVME